VASASGETATYEAFEAFSKQAATVVSPKYVGWLNEVDVISGWLQYKQDEKRVLKSWRLREFDPQAYSPRRFTIEGSNDGLNWAAIDSTYAASDYVGDGANLWGGIQLTPGNLTAYLYHRINITANNGDAKWLAIGEMEFNTVLPSDYYLVEEGAMRNNLGNVIERVYLAKIVTGASSAVLQFENFAVAKQDFVEVDVHKNLTVQGDVRVGGKIHSPGAVTAWVQFDGTQSPPYIKESYNVTDIVDQGVGTYRIIFESPMDYTGYPCAATAAAESSAAAGYVGVHDTQRAHVGIFTRRGDSGALLDSPLICLSVFGGRT